MIDTLREKPVPEHIAKKTEGPIDSLSKSKPQL